MDPVGEGLVAFIGPAPRCVAQVVEPQAGAGGILLELHQRQGPRAAGGGVVDRFEDAAGGVAGAGGAGLHDVGDLEQAVAVARGLDQPAAVALAAGNPATVEHLQLGDIGTRQAYRPIDRHGALHGQAAAPSILHLVAEAHVDGAPGSPQQLIHTEAQGCVFLGAAQVHLGAGLNGEDPEVVATCGQGAATGDQVANAQGIRLVGVRHAGQQGAGLDRIGGALHAVGKVAEGGHHTGGVIAAGDGEAEGALSAQHPVGHCQGEAGLGRLPHR